MFVYSFSLSVGYPLCYFKFMEDDGDSEEHFDEDFDEELDKWLDEELD